MRCDGWLIVACAAIGAAPGYVAPVTPGTLTPETDAVLEKWELHKPAGLVAELKRFRKQQHTVYGLAEPGPHHFVDLDKAEKGYNAKVNAARGPLIAAASKLDAAAAASPPVPAGQLEASFAELQERKNEIRRIWEDFRRALSDPDYRPSET